MAVGLTACAHSAGPGVSVEKVESNIPFGLPSTTTTLPAAAPPSVAALNLTSASQPLPAFSYQTTTTFNYGSPSYSTEAATCPQPPYGASPDRAATTSVAKPPKAGAYRWQIVTSQPVAGTNQTLTQRVYVTYYIENVSKVTQTANPQGGQTSSFTYDEVSPGEQGGTVTTTYQVTENALQVSESAGNFGQAQHAGAPDRGIALAAVVDRNAAGRVIASFHPSPAVLLFPLDVQAPESFQATGVDPSNGASFSTSAQVSGSLKRDNACGQLVDGWEVTGTQTFSSGSSGAPASTGSVEYAVATQYGGLFSFSSLTPTGSSQTEQEIIGQLSPDPLPPGK